MGEILRVPTETARLATGLVGYGGKVALRAGEQAINRFRPGYVPRNVMETQRVIKDFEDNFGVAGHLLERGLDHTELDERVQKTADTMVKTGFVDERTAVEVRPFLPANALQDPEIVAQCETVTAKLRDTLARKHDISVISMPHPIIPSMHDSTPVDAATTWAAFAWEFAGLQHQLDGTHARLAVFGFSNRDSLGKFFGGRIANQVPGHNLYVLRHVGSLPEHNLLVGTSTRE